MISRVFLLSASPSAAGAQGPQRTSVAGSTLGSGPRRCSGSYSMFSVWSDGLFSLAASALVYPTDVSPPKCCCSCYPVLTAASLRTPSLPSGSGGPFSGFSEPPRSVSIRGLTIPPCAVSMVLLLRPEPLTRMQRDESQPSAGSARREWVTALGSWGRSKGFPGAGAFSCVLKKGLNPGTENSGQCQMPREWHEKKRWSSGA